MKQIFSKSFTDLYPLVKELKRDYGCKTNKDIRDALVVFSAMQYRRDGRELLEYDKGMISTDAEMCYDELEGKCVHFFIDDAGFKEFLKNTEIKDFDFYKNLTDYAWKTDQPLGYGLSEDMTKEEMESKKEYGNYRFTFSLHFLNEVDAPRYTMWYNENHGYLGMVILDSKQMQKNFDFVPFWDSKLSKKAVKLNEWLRIGVNFLYYIQAFPENVKSGIPKGYKTENKGRNNTVSVCDKIRVSEGGKVTPHFRRGHFRFLGSEFYTKMRGKTIFIESTVVNSKNNKVIVEN